MRDVFDWLKIDNVKLSDHFLVVEFWNKQFHFKVFINLSDDKHLITFECTLAENFTTTKYQLS